MLLSVANIHKSFSQFDILKGVTFSLQEGEKTVLLGANGAGKTTLCQLINGNLTPDQGRIQLKPGKNINYIRQFEHFSPELTVKKYLHASFSQLHETEKEMQLLEPDLDRGKVQIKYNELLEKYNRLKIFANDRTLKAVLQKTGLTAAVLKQPLTALSGGQKQKVFLCRLKLTRADLILLDEPTNHLDLPALAWLEQYLKQSKAALILITHDEQLLRRTATRILYLQNGVLSSYQGSYQNYLDSFTRHNSLLLKKIKEQTTKMQKAREVIDRFQTGTRANQAKAKQRQLANLELPDMPLQEKEISLPEFPLRQKLPKEILHVKKATAVYKKEPVFKGISFSIFRGEKTALLGPNGCGKSTLLKLVAGRLSPQQGEIITGAGITPAYFDQEYAMLPGHLSPFAFLHSQFRTLSEKELRTKLGNFLLSGDQVFTPVNRLSGGEKCRLQLLYLLLKGDNFFLFDEPANNLDMASVSILQAALQKYRGSFIMVSHNRSLLDKLCRKFVLFTPDGIKIFKGTWQEHAAAIMRYLQPAYQIKKKNKPQPAGCTGSLPKKRKMNPIKLKQLEKKIIKLEERRTELENSFNDPRILQNHQQLQAFQAEYKQIKQEVSRLTALWEAQA